MRTTLIDPRDQTWEINDPTFPVYFWRSTGGGETPGCTSGEWEISEADIDEVLAWADAHAAVPAMSVWVVQCDDGLGLIRLAGFDPTAAADVWPACAHPRRG